jgi:predicted tellurium resistance membrane protein TerC
VTSKITEKERDDAIFWGVIGVIILISSIIWLGKEVGWWQFEFPFWPVIAIWIGIAILLAAIKKLYRIG